MVANQKTEVTVGEVRISFQHLIKPFVQGRGEGKYSITMLIPKSNYRLKELMDEAMEAAIQWGMASKWNGIRPDNIQLPVYDGDGMRPSGGFYGEECNGCYVMTASSRYKPEVVDGKLQPILVEGEIYSGMYAYVSVNFFPYANSGRRGVGCGLGPVMKSRDGDRLGGRVTVQRAFGDIRLPHAQNVEPQESGTSPF